MGGQENNFSHHQQSRHNENSSYCQQSEAWCQSADGFGENQRMMLNRSGKHTHVKELSVIGARSSGMSNHLAWGSAQSSASDFSTMENTSSSPIPGSRNGSRSPGSGSRSNRRNNQRNRNTSSRKKRRKKKNTQRTNQSNFGKVSSNNSNNTKIGSSGRNKNFPYNKNSQKKTLKTTIRLKPENKNENSS